jgi:hypothetical protein
VATATQIEPLVSTNFETLEGVPMAAPHPSVDALDQTRPGSDPPVHPGDWLALKIWIGAFLILTAMNLWDAFAGLFR